MHSDPSFSKVFQQGYKCVAKRALTLGNILSLSLVVSQTTPKPTWLKYTGCYRCAHTTCICCRYIQTSNTFVSAVTKTTYSIKQYINCASSNVVYLFTFKSCGLQYTGSTTCSLKTRIRRHLSDINAQFVSNISAVSRHIIEVHNRDPSCLFVQAIEKVGTSVRSGNTVSPKL